MEFTFKVYVDFNDYFVEAINAETGEKVLKPRINESFEQDLYELSKKEISKMFFNSFRDDNVFTQCVKKIIFESKDEIIEKVVQKVNKSLLSNKKINELRKEINGEQNEKEN